MRPDEVRDIVLDALRGEGWTSVEAAALRPAKFGEGAGLRFDLDLVNQSGLIYKGTAAAAERQGTLRRLLWLAPVEHYYGRDHAAVAQMLDGVRFVD